MEKEKNNFKFTPLVAGDVKESQIVYCVAHKAGSIVALIQLELRRLVWVARVSAVRYRNLLWIHAYSLVAMRVLQMSVLPH